jgi:hypothetical protein
MQIIGVGSPFCNPPINMSHTLCALIDERIKSKSSRLQKISNNALVVVFFGGVITALLDMWNTMEYLYQRGKLRVNGVDWGEYRKLRRATSDGGKMSLDFNDISVRDALNHLSFLTGLHFRVESGDAEKLISISLREVTLGEIISRISTETGIRIEQAKKRPSIK